MPRSLEITIFGLSITSSWGNGHATTFRALVKALRRRGHHVTFLEADRPWYAEHRDPVEADWGEVRLYSGTDELKSIARDELRRSDLVIVGSYVPDGVAIGEWVCDEATGITAFYDIDTPVTLSRLERGEKDYLSRELVPRYDMYLSFAGGAALRLIEDRFGSPCSRPLYCSVDPELYRPRESAAEYDLGYLGTYSDDRQPPLERLMFDAARAWPDGKFVVAGSQYPEHIDWPSNVKQIRHLPPAEHCDFYNSQRLTLNVTRALMVRAGHSPSVRLFEAAACGVPVISDWWTGLDEFFRPEKEILISHSPEQSLHWLRELSDSRRKSIGSAARAVVLREHTSDRRAAQLEEYFEEARKGRTSTHVIQRV